MVSNGSSASAAINQCQHSLSALAQLTEPINSDSLTTAARTTRSSVNNKASGKSSVQPQQRRHQLKRGATSATAASAPQPRPKGAVSAPQSPPQSLRPKNAVAAHESQKHRQQPARIAKMSTTCPVIHLIFRGQRVLRHHRQPRGAEHSKMESSSRDAEESDSESSSGSEPTSSHEANPVPKVVVSKNRSQSRHSSGSEPTSSHEANPVPANPVPKVVVSKNRSQSRHRKCEHGKRKNLCKQCNGSALCKHQRQKLHCKECRPITCKAYCEHNKQRSRCQLCGGSGICKHGREKYRCKDCRGSQ